MNYFTTTQGLILARLRAKLPSNLQVRTATDIAQVKDQAVGQPEVWVVFHQDSAKDHSGNITLLEQQWIVLYLAPGLLPDMERDGDTVSTITKALAGYDSYTSGLSAFKRVGTMLPAPWGGTGLVAYGQIFTVNVTL